jgi:hypothetical protein
MKLHDRGRLVLIFLAILAAFAAFAVWFATATPGERHRGPLPPLGLAGLQLAEILKAHVRAVAGEEHNVDRPEALERSARYIETTLSALGYAVDRDEFETEGVKVRNLEVSRVGPGPSKRLIVIGAHYDSRAGAVGANDNGSGVAALLELARFLKTVHLADGVEVQLVFYVNEELPWSYTEHMGSYVHAKGLARDGREVAAMLSLETIGWYSDAPNTQRYPFPLSLFYPSTGNFIGFVANLKSRGLMHRVIAAFRSSVAFPAEGAALPESTPKVSASDHWSYWQFGWPALMVTDTAPFRYPHYHTLQDTPDKIDYERLARVVTGLEGVLRELIARRHHP